MELTHERLFCEMSNPKAGWFFSKFFLMPFDLGFPQRYANIRDILLSLCYFQDYLGTFFYDYCNNIKKGVIFLDFTKIVFPI